MSPPKYGQTARVFHVAFASRSFVSIAALVAGGACSSSSAIPIQSGPADDAAAPDDATTSRGDDGSSHDAGIPVHPKDSGGATCGTPIDSGVTFASNGDLLCGANMPCNLKQNTCCVDATGNASCVTGHNGCGVGLSAAFQCIEQTDCASGEVCCGYAANGSAGSKCQSISGNGNKCSPAPSSTQGSVQFCQKTCECKDGTECLPQSCQVPNSPLPAQLTMCGLQSQAPYNCKVR